MLEVNSLIPPTPSHIVELARIVENNPNISDFAIFKVNDIYFELDGCMEWSSIRISVGAWDGPAIYSAYWRGTWKYSWKTNDDALKEKVLEIIRNPYGAKDEKPMKEEDQILPFVVGGFALATILSMLFMLVVK